MGEENNANWAVVAAKINAYMPIPCGGDVPRSLAERSIRALGYETYMPLYRKVMKGFRIDEETGKRVRIRGSSIVMRSVFREFFFVLVPDGRYAADIDRAPGISRVFRHPGIDCLIGRPKIVRARVIAQIRASAEAGDFDDKSAHRGLRIGDRVRVSTGFIVWLTRLDDRGRAQWVTHMLGREVRGKTEDIRTLEPVEDL